MPQTTTPPLSNTPFIGQCSTIGLTNDRLQRSDADQGVVLSTSPRNTATALGGVATTTGAPSACLVQPAHPVALNLMANPASLQQQPPSSTADFSKKTVVSQSLNPMIERIQQELRSDRLREYELLVARQPQRPLDTIVIIPLPRD